MYCAASIAKLLDKCTAECLKDVIHWASFLSSLHAYFNLRISDSPGLVSQHL